MRGNIGCKFDELDDFTNWDSLLTKEVRNEILGETQENVVYDMLGNNVHDLLYIDQVAGLENLNKKNADGVKNADIKTPLTKETGNP